MRCTNALRRLVRSILLEVGNVPPPDEPGLAPDEALGQYALPRLNRTDRRYEDVPEKNTALESKLQNALVRHYEYGDSKSLAAIWDEVYPIAARGLYPNLLVPPAGPVYRVMSTSVDRAAKILGLTEGEVTASPETAQAATSPRPFTGKDFISSWTSAIRQMPANAFISGLPDSVSILLVAQSPAAGQFLMNPEGFAQDFHLGRMFKNESEVIGGGTIQVSSAAWVWHGLTSSASPPPSKRSHKVLEQLIDAVGGVST